MDWLLADPLGRTFGVLPVFTAVMLALGVARGRHRDDLVRQAAPPLYALVAGAILVAAAVAVPGPGGGGDRLLDGLAIGWPALAVLAVGVALVPAVYLAELAASDGWLGWQDRRRRRDPGGSTLDGLVLPGGVGASLLRGPMDAGEAFTTVREISRQPVWFAVLSVVTAAVEELLYRGLMLSLLDDAGVLLVGAVAVQALVYAANHLPFGVPAFLGKLIAGLLFGALAAATGSVVPALGAHLALQVLVWRRLRRADTAAPVAATAGGSADPSSACSAPVAGPVADLAAGGSR